MIQKSHWDRKRFQTYRYGDQNVTNSHPRCKQTTPHSGKPFNNCPGYKDRKTHLTSSNFKNQWSMYIWCLQLNLNHNHLSFLIIIIVIIIIIILQPFSVSNQRSWPEWRQRVETSKALGSAPVLLHGTGVCGGRVWGGTINMDESNETRESRKKTSWRKSPTNVIFLILFV